jgi:nucleotide-binding universal stress UspA family protein
MRILLAHDGSGHAAQAATLVSSLALPPTSLVRVVSVIEPTMVPLVAWEGSAGAGYSPEMETLIREYNEGVVAAVVKDLRTKDRTVEAAVPRGRPADVIVDEARTFAADLIVIGSRGHSSIASLVLGSVSGEVIDHAGCPVLVARQPGIIRVVFATDGSPSAAAAEAMLASWPMFADPPIRVVSVAEVSPPWSIGIAPTMVGAVVNEYARDLEAAKAEHRDIADGSARRLRAAGRDSTADLRSGDAAAEIIEAIGEWRADLVVMGSRGRTGLTRLLLGSVARNVVHGTSASILVVRAAIEA